MVVAVAVGVCCCGSSGSSGGGCQAVELLLQGRLSELCEFAL